MRIGLCVPREQLRIAADSGADFAELSVATDLIPDRPESEFRAIRDRLLASPVPVEAFNSFVRQWRIVGPDVDRHALAAYVETALLRAAQVGGKVIVLGSAGARNVPDGFPREKALEQIVDFLGLCSESSTRHGVVVAVEPLCRAESNILNTVAETDRLVLSAALPGVGALADTFHMEQEGEPLSAIGDAAPRILHVHTAGRGRKAPGPGDDRHAALFDVCRSLAPEVRLSVECSWDDWETESRMAVAHLSGARDRLVSP